MKRVRPLFAIITVAISLLANAAPGAEPAAKPAPEEINKICPISGKPVDPKITAVYEGKTYAFAAEAFRKKFTEARENSLYHKLGGKAAIDAAVELFYTKVLADNRIKHYFDDINMNKQRRKQKEFLAAAFGVPLLGPARTCAPPTPTSPDSMTLISAPSPKTFRKPSRN